MALRGSGFRWSAPSRIANPEAYRLRASGNEVLIEASDPRGLFYGAQTLRQLVTDDAGSRYVPNVDITDSPRFRWRGLLIDEARHFFGKDVLFKIIDEMAAYKLNRLKLHLTDYEGWRLEVPAFPKLTEVGSLVDGKPQYFTTADMREIVQYAADRHIMVVPEIEMPGHAGAAARILSRIFQPRGRRLQSREPEDVRFHPRRANRGRSACSPRRTSISPATRSATRLGTGWRTWTG